MSYGARGKATGTGSADDFDTTAGTAIRPSRHRRVGVPPRRPRTGRPAVNVTADTAYRPRSARNRDRAAFGPRRYCHSSVTRVRGDLIRRVFSNSFFLSYIHAPKSNVSCRLKTNRSPTVKAKLTSHTNEFYQYYNL